MRRGVSIRWRAMSDEHPDEWDSYPCRVDDAPASIFLNLAYQRARPPSLDTLYSCGLQMLEPGEHGVGEARDAEKLWQLEAEVGHTEEGEERPSGAQVMRTDATDLEHIHAVVMDLIELAERHDGEYDGWGSPVVTP